MASVIKVQKKVRDGVTDDGKVKWKHAPGVMHYAKIKTLDGDWVQQPTHQPSPQRALKWAMERCACDNCGGPDRLRKQQETAAAIQRAADEAEQRKACGELMDTWIKTLTNRSAKDDRSRLAKHVRPTFASLRPDEVDLPAVMRWIDALRAGTAPTPPPLVGKDGKPKRGRGRAAGNGKLSDATIRHALNLLSRFYSWAVERGHASMNPVRQIPTGKRPQQTAKDEAQPWIDDDKTVRELMQALAPPFRECFYLGNRSGLRPGEQRGLRVSDLAFLSEGVIRVRYSDDGPLKEDKRKTGKVKWVPAADDAAIVLASWLTKRKAEEAKPEDHVFMPELTRGALKQRMEDAWREAADALGLELGYYEATRHSFASRNLAAGASLDEVAAALGHASPLTTQRHYAHFIRKTFSSTLRAGIGATVAEADGKVLPFEKSTAHG